ncbi:MAG: prolipoprotein diacylglyceryl transferase, partial [Clostridia bacterium]|nr:prolipoprotein diacylglyceryl transferase [Clostridia bacterium]
WGNFFNAEAFGRDIIAAADGSLPFYAMTLSNHPQAAVHPLFLYESLLNLTLFIVLHFFFHKRLFKGEIFLLYMAGYGLIRTFTEGIRGNDALLIWNTNIRVSQLLAVLFTIGSLAVLFLILYKRRSVKNEAAFDDMMTTINNEEGNE